MGEQPGAAAAAGSLSAAAPASAWSPFRYRLFAAMWGAQFVSNVGSWMQTVAAQWLMLTLTSSAAYVALVQTAAGLPVVLFAVLAGTIGDLVDRRRFLLVTQALMLVAAVALGALAIAGLVTPWVLLALIFAVGTGQALTSPTWQLIPPGPAGFLPGRAGLFPGRYPAVTERSARQTRCGVAGMSMCRTPRCATASMMAFCTAGVAPIVPASPMPLAPSGL
jgi:MFS family permease